VALQKNMRKEPPAWFACDWKPFNPGFLVSTNKVAPEAPINSNVLGAREGGTKYRLPEVMARSSSSQTLQSVNK
jgi:hypothetical protein